MGIPVRAAHTRDGSWVLLRSRPRRRGVAPCAAGGRTIPPGAYYSRRKGGRPVDKLFHRIFQVLCGGPAAGPNTSRCPGQHARKKAALQVTTAETGSPTSTPPRPPLQTQQTATQRQRDVSRFRRGLESSSGMLSSPGFPGCSFAEGVGGEGHSPGSRPPRAVCRRRQPSCHRRCTVLVETPSSAAASAWLNPW
jgi:hypothetical protein